jgi:hypothetical protein
MGRLYVAWYTEYLETFHQIHSLDHHGTGVLGKIFFYEGAWGKITLSKAWLDAVTPRRDPDSERCGGPHIRCGRASEIKRETSNPKEKECVFEREG